MILYYVWTCHVYEPIVFKRLLIKVLKEVNLILSDEISEAVLFLLIVLVLLEHFKYGLFFNQKKIKKAFILGKSLEF